MDIKKIIRSRIVQIAGAAVLFFGAGVLVTALAVPAGAVTGRPLQVEVSADARRGFTAIGNMQAAFREISRKVLPSVVEIDVVDVVKQTVPSIQSPFDFFFGTPRSAAPQQREFRQEGLGSGVIVRQAGGRVYVLTNNHVVNNADEITVVLPDKRRFRATVTGKDDRKDLALVSFPAAGTFPVATLGDSDTVQTGDWVIAVGNPLGFESTVTEGIISAVGRRPQPGTDIAGYTDYFQTDAAVNRGNSGGALVNIEGEVIGINTWIASPSGGSIGLGFAIPINNAKKAVEQFITKGKVAYGWLGIAGNDISAAARTDLGVGDTAGALVTGVYSNSPATQAGLLPGDFITAVNGRSVQDMTGLALAVGDLPSGARARLDVIRQGAPVTLSVAIGEKPDATAMKNADLWPGLSVVKITADIRSQLTLSAGAGGLVIGRVDQGSTAQATGFRAGDIIKTVNNRPVNDLRGFYAAVNDLSRSRVMFRLTRDAGDVILALERR